MKKLIALVAVIVLVMAIAVPVMAETKIGIVSYYLQDENGKIVASCSTWEDVNVDQACPGFWAEVLQHGNYTVTQESFPGEYPSARGW